MTQTPTAYTPSTPEQQAFETVMTSCPGKTVASTVVGFGLGAFLGLFMSSVDWQMATEEFQKLSTKEQLKLTARDMGKRTFSSAKNFAMVGGVFSGTECLVEQVSRFTLDL